MPPFRHKLTLANGYVQHPRSLQGVKVVGGVFVKLQQRGGRHPGLPVIYSKSAGKKQEARQVKSCSQGQFPGLWYDWE